MTAVIEYLPVQCKTPVLLIVFNRLETTKAVIEAIRKAGPPRLYLASDGPRAGCPGEVQKVRAVREHVTGLAGWPCEVKTLFSDRNLGCRYGPIRALDWFFAHEEMGIILEDDCLPGQSFFGFCEKLLNMHKNDAGVFGIGGEQYLTGVDSYGFVSYPLTWGWASWRRAWAKFNDMPGKNDLSALFPEKERSGTRRFWASRLKELSEREVDWWDYQLALAMIKNRALFAFPPANLISNIGFGGDATHTKKTGSPIASREIREIDVGSLEKVGPSIHQGYNRFMENTFFCQRSLPGKIQRRLKKRLSAPGTAGETAV